MSMLGIYFGIKSISIVETKGKRILNNINIPLSTLSTGLAEEKIPEEVKMVALLKDELRRNKIEAKEATVALSGKDLFVRTFEMPFLPREEMSSAVLFEAKKYIPFKIEDLVSDFEPRIDKRNRRNSILFVGIKKEILDKYFSILNQLDIKAGLLEYSAFGILRLFKLAHIHDRGIIGIISTDFQEEDEVNFTVLENGFPLFSRDITLFGTGGDLLKPRLPEPAQSLDKLKTELRVSLDYYERKFPNKNVERIFLISGEQHPDLIAFIKEIGLSAQFIDIKRYTGQSASLSLSAIKGYSSSLSKVIRTDLKINLAAIKIRIKPAAEKVAQIEVTSLLSGLRIELKVVILGALVCIATFIFGLYLQLPLQKNLKDILALRPAVNTINPDASYEDLTSKNSEYKIKVGAWVDLTTKRPYLTEPLDAIPRLIPEGVWLENLSFKEQIKGITLELTGMAYADDNAKEIGLINSFLSALKDDAKFKKYFKEIDIVSLNTMKTKEKSVVQFRISAVNYHQEQ